MTRVAPPPESVHSSPWSPPAAAAGAGAFAFLVYAATAARTITWWEGSDYPLAACTLGITPPPGSLLLTLAGWVASRVPLVQPVAFRLNLLAGLIAAVTVALVTRVSILLAAPEGREPRGPELAAGAAAGLAFAFSLSIWLHAVQFTPYILTACFTALILTTALAWWQRAAEADASAWLFLLFLLLGLDFSVHRTNALLLPAVLLWITLRRARAWTRRGPWAAMGAGLVLGLACQLLLIPLSRRQPAFDLAEPGDLARLWSYVSLERFGGGFLFRVLPRTADFVRVQLADYAGFLRQNLLPGGVSAPLALATAAFLLAGWAAAFATAARRSLGLLGFFLCSSLGAIVYFNLPAHYFRGMDRHYLPSLVLVTPLLAVGAAVLLRAAARAPRGVRQVLSAGLGVLLVAVPLHSWGTNHGVCDLSRVRFTESYSRDVLEPLPRRAILLTNGDNDTFPLWYLQQVEGVRPDVTVVNVSMTNVTSYVARLRRSAPGLGDLMRGREAPDPRVVRDTTFAIALGEAAQAALPRAAGLPDSLKLEASGRLLPQDFVVLDLLRTVGWRRPVFAACTVSPQILAWLRPCLSFDGLALRVVPTTDPAPPDARVLRHRLLEEVRYAGLADTSILMDPTSRSMCSNYLAALVQLARLQLEAGDAQGCLATLDFAERRAPPARLGMEADALAELRTRASRAPSLRDRAAGEGLGRGRER